MGRVRPTYIKRMAEGLVDKEEFTTDYEKNKKKINELNLFTSKTIRNRVAGYIVKVVRNKKY